MDWRKVPSLSALRAFEAAARHRSLSAAARELNVTHAAVAQHLRALEDHFGCRLMLREGRGMALTAEGTELAQALAEGFGLIAGAARDLAERDAARPLRVALTPSFASGWLMPRIGTFWAAHPEIRLEIAPSPELVDLRRDGYDLAIRYGRGPWPGVRAEHLVAANHVAAAAPSLLGEARPGDLSDLQGAHWLLERGRYEERIWAEANGLDLSRARITEFDMLGLVIDAVRSGHGVGILPRPLIERELASGELVALREESAGADAYHILTRPSHVTPAQKAFIAWLKRQV